MNVIDELVKMRDDYERQAQELKAEIRSIPRYTSTKWEFMENNSRNPNRLSDEEVALYCGWDIKTARAYRKGVEDQDCLDKCKEKHDNVIQLNAVKVAA